MTTGRLRAMCGGCPDAAGDACVHCKACVGATCLCVGIVSLPALLLVGVIVAGLAGLT